MVRGRGPATQEECDGGNAHARARALRGGGVGGGGRGAGWSKLAPREGGGVKGARWPIVNRGWSKRSVGSGR